VSFGVSSVEPLGYRTIYWN